MVGPWPHRAFTVRALSKTYGPMWLRCDVCRRYARLKLAGLHDVDYRIKTFKAAIRASRTKHGRYSQASIAARREVRSLIRALREMFGPA